MNAYRHVFNDVTAFPKHITVDLAARYAAAFGAIEAGKFIDKLFLEQREGNDYSLQFFDSEFSDVKERPDYVKLEIPDGDVLEFCTVLQAEDTAIFAPPPILKFNRDKSLIETTVNDDDHVVVERWGSKAWRIELNGILIDLKNRVYPSDEIRRLSKVWEYKGVLKAVGVQFEEKDIDSVYFRDIEFQIINGFSDTIMYKINATAIKEVSFNLLKPNE